MEVFQILVSNGDLYINLFSLRITEMGRQFWDQLNPNTMRYVVCSEVVRNKKSQICMTHKLQNWKQRFITSHGLQNWKVADDGIVAPHVMQVISYSKPAFLPLLIQELVIDSDRHVFLDVYADWCGPCVQARFQRKFPQAKPGLPPTQQQSQMRVYRGSLLKMEQSWLWLLLGRGQFQCIPLYLGLNLTFWHLFID